MERCAFMGNGVLSLRNPAAYGRRMGVVFWLP